MPKPYLALTARGQARRLSRLVRAALPAWAVKVRRVRLVKHGINTVFRVDTPDGPLAARVMRPGPDAQLPAAYGWMRALADSGVRAMAPMPTRDGALWTLAGAPGVPERRKVALLTWAPGRQLPRAPTRAQVHGLGALLAQLHAHAASYAGDVAGVSTMRDAFHGPLEPLLLTGRAGVSAASSPRADSLSLATPSLRALAERAQRALEPRLQRLYDQGPVHLVHADVHAGNVHHARSGLTVVDFDDLRLGHPARDLGICAYYLDKLAGARWADLRAGYTSLRPWPIPPTWHIDELKAAHCLSLLNDVLHESPDDPAIGHAIRRFMTRWEATISGYLGWDGPTESPE